MSRSILLCAAARPQAVEPAVCREIGSAPATLRCMD